MGRYAKKLNEILLSQAFDDETDVYEGSAMDCNPTKEEMYAAAELVAFDDMLHAGFTAQAIRNTAILGREAIESIRRVPELEPEFKGLLRSYVYHAASKNLGGQA